MDSNPTLSTPINTQTNTQTNTPSSTKTIFENIYVLDTNIILNDVVNIEILSQYSSNLIVIPETVMDELDVKKTGFEEINFQARSFGRLLEKADITSVVTKDGVTISRMHINGDKNITIDVISKVNYDVVSQSVDKHILNDRKILEVAEYVDKNYDGSVVFISNDVMCRLRAISLGLTTEVMGKNIQEDIEVYTEIQVDFDELPSSISVEELKVGDTIFGVCLYNEYGNKLYYYRSGNNFFAIDEKDLKKQNTKPLNIEQKMYSSMILDPYYDVIVCDSAAGTGKTLVAISTAMKLIDTYGDKYHRIVYMRKTINADDEEMGFLPGDESAKYAPYLAPLYSNLEHIISAKYNKKFTQEEMESKITDVMKDYQITPMFEGFLRGTNIPSGSIVIIDEIQNESVASIRTALTRINEGCKAILIGSNKQIDNKYINRHTSALTYLLNKLLQENSINIGAVKLVKTVRSRIAEWADEFR